MERTLIKLEALLEGMHREMQADREHVERRHRETSQRLDGINGKVGLAHERATALETTVATLKIRIETVAERTHKLMGEAQKWIADVYEKASGDVGDADKDVMTGSRLKWALWIFGGGFGACAALMKLMGKL